MKVYPIYDWTFEDIWKYIAEYDVVYNKIYDFMYMLGFGINEMRISNLIHIHAFKCLTSLHDFEPDTYDKLLERIPGIHVAARYAYESSVYDVKTLPTAFKTWKEYKEYLLETCPINDKEIFINRFKKQPDHELTYKAQCKQLLLNSKSNTVTIPSQKTLEKRKEEKEKKIKEWRDLL